MGYQGVRPGIGLGYPTGQKAKQLKPGYMGGAGNYLGASLGAGGYGAGLGQGAYLGGAAGKLGAAGALGQGYGEGATGHLGPMAGNGHAGYGNGYGDGLGAALGTGGYAGQVQGGYGDGGYPYPAQQLNLGAEGAKTANKYGAAAGYGPQQTGFGAQLGATQDVLGEQAGKYDRGNAALGNGYKG
ncbi:glycine-rich cell wall structural protein 2 isoform X1 [Notothenia coriiceps]|uniref:Glycine-rich cell wall structural protein 2 isoform X1 n=1 Tax=Notothenia coriiceps TaxID=8208 RepID=A0A6I9MTF2_9TELE|nr:PREDICTED: glycine-rich cell wall structural protein 2-like isoform X1 [Notothenia coriiceps]